MTDYSKFTDQELIDLLKDGSHAAFNEVHHRYYAVLMRFAYNMISDRESCDDMVQDVFVWFWEHRSQHRMSSIKGYLLMAVKYQAAKFVRRGKVRENHLLAELGKASYSLNEEKLELKELQAIITSFTHQLPEKCAAIFKMSREEQLSNREIADRLGISEVTVAVQIKRALDKLRGNLGRMHFWLHFFV